MLAGAPHAPHDPESLVQHITLEREEGILVVTLSRGKANALHCEMVDELQQALNHAAADDRTHGVVITSAHGRRCSAAASTSRRSSGTRLTS